MARRWPWYSEQQLRQALERDDLTWREREIIRALVDDPHGGRKTAARRFRMTQDSVTGRVDRLMHRQ
jgi:DNA-binding MarR family transcriptional regulator